MTILAIAALGQMLVIMHAGIDLSTPGVMFLGGYLIVGVGQATTTAASGSRSSPCLGLGVLVGLINGILVGILRLNPLIVTLAVGQIVLAEGLRYSNGRRTSRGADRARVLGARTGRWTSARLLDRRRDHRRGRAAPPLHGARPALPGGGREPAGRMDGRRPRAGLRRVRLRGGRHALRARGRAARVVRVSVDPAFGASYLLAPIAAVVIAGASLSGGLASATSTWVAAFALTLLNQMLLILGLAVGWQFIVFGAAIIVGMSISGDRVASLLAASAANERRRRAWPVGG